MSEMGRVCSFQPAAGSPWICARCAQDEADPSHQSGRVLSTDGANSPAVRSAAPGRSLSDTDPYDEDGYCDWCGNGRWKFHAPDCEWADQQDETTPARPSS